MSEMTSAIELNDQDILVLEKVLAVLNAKQGTRTNMEGFRLEAIERFANAGFQVDVKTFTTTVDGVYYFQMEIVDRYEGEFDPDQMVHEATNDLLELGTGGVLKSAPIMAKQAGHSHGGGGSKLWTPGSN